MRYRTSNLLASMGARTPYESAICTRAVRAHPTCAYLLCFAMARAKQTASLNASVKTKKCVCRKCGSKGKYLKLSTYYAHQNAQAAFGAHHEPTVFQGLMNTIQPPSPSGSRTRRKRGNSHRSNTEASTTLPLPKRVCRDSGASSDVGYLDQVRLSSPNCGVFC